MSSSRWEWPAIAIAAATRLWLTAGRAVEAIGWADYDDLWFVRRAQAILDGRWLGGYDHLTLIKGPGYPLWIAFVSAQGIPLLFAQQLLYALACLAVTRAVAPAVRSPGWRVALFAVLLFNPISFADENATRVTREAFYPAVSLLVFAGVAGALLRLDGRRRVVAAWSVLGGFALALFWMTREEGVWIVPLLACASIPLLMRRAWLVVVVHAMIFAGAYGAVMIANRQHYGIFEVVEFKESSFLRAYGSLARVRQHRSQARVPVPKEVRERVYAVSPAFAELRPFLEGELGANWIRVGNPPVEGEIMGGMFMWAFREAVAEAGYYERGAVAVKSYYDRVSREIDAARVAGKLEADPGRATIAPPLLEGQIGEIVRTFFRALIRITRFLDYSIGPRYSVGAAPELREYARVGHTALAPRAKEIRSVRLAGWAFHVDGPLDLVIEPRMRVPRLPTPGLFEHFQRFPPAQQAGFDIAATGPDASLALYLRGRLIERIPLGMDKPGSINPNVRMSVDRYDVDAIEPQLRNVDVLRLRILKGIGAVYRALFLPFFVLAAIFYLRKRRGGSMAFLIAGLLGAIAARVLILSMINVTSFVALTGAYASPAYAFLLAAGMLMISGSARSSSARTGSSDRSGG